MSPIRILLNIVGFTFLGIGLLLFIHQFFIIMDFFPIEAIVMTIFFVIGIIIFGIEGRIARKEKKKQS